MSSARLSPLSCTRVAWRPCRMSWFGVPCRHDCTVKPFSFSMVTWLGSYTRHFVFETPLLTQKRAWEPASLYRRDHQGGWPGICCLIVGINSSHCSLHASYSFIGAHCSHASSAGRSDAVPSKRPNNSKLPRERILLLSLRGYPQFHILISYVGAATEPDILSLWVGSYW